MDTIFFHFFVLLNLVAKLFGVNCFHLWVRIYIEVFSYCTFTETFAIGFQKLF